MLHKYAGMFLVLGHALTDSYRQLFEWGLFHPKESTSIALPDDTYETAVAALGNALACCKWLPLGTLEKEIERAIQEYGQGGAIRDRFQVELQRLYKRFEDELANKNFYYIPSERFEFYGKTDLFGSLVAEKFRSTAEDIENAGNCYALGQSTATVLHLMRAMESAVSHLSRQLSVSITPQDTWGQMLSKMDDKIKILPETDEPQKRRKEQWSEARANLWHVKQAWRNPGMHPKQTYTMPQARDVLDAVRVFMGTLAQL
ncbi:MAG: hypothetical protein KGJ66_07560 [Alphaproteobacteria bacterium]|nr:hypothetical protein [Alphaproteobacteria bacterium]